MKKARTRTMFLYVCILYSLLMSASCSEFHDKVFNNLLRLCPEQYVPSENDTGLNQTSEYDSCCTDGFSYSSITNSVNKTNQAQHGHSCLFPRTHDVTERKPNERSYTMITDPPKDGCLLQDFDPDIIIGNDFYQPTCKDSDVIPFRRFLPVYSKSSGFIYKSPHCASCHGQFDVKLWTTIAYCQTPASILYEIEDCEFQFVYPGNHDDIQHLECFTDYYSECPVDVSADYDKFQLETDLSVNELSDACSMDNLPMFADARFAKNVFCYICHYCKNGCKFLVNRCMPPIKDVPLRNIGNSLVRILDPRMISQLHTGQETVCGLEHGERVCYELFCPLGQVLTFDGLEKKCQMDSTQWTVRQFSILLLLEFDYSIDVNETNLSTILTQTQNFWPNTWYAEMLYRPFARNVDMVRAVGFLYNVTKHLPVYSIKHVYVQLTYRHTTVNPAVLVRDLENIRMKSSYLTVDGKRYRARQTLGKSKLWTIKTELSPGDMRMLSIPDWQLAGVEPSTRLLYKPLRKNTNRKPAHFLNKLMLCKQVELASTNFHVATYLGEPILLYNNKTGQRLYHNEFTKGSGRIGEPSFRMCVSDARLKASNDHVRLQIGLKLLLFATVMFNAL